MLLSLTQIAFSGEQKDKPTKERKEAMVENYDSKTHGALQVMSVSADPHDWFMVFQGKKQLVPPGKPRLGTTVELAPGNYTARVNGSERTVSIRAGKKTILWTGELFVQAAKDTPGWYVPFKGKQRMLASNSPKVNTAIALFAGTYQVVWFEGGVGKKQDLGQAELKPGQRTVIRK
jgi:hypothetical protein